jgi:lipopolysaccharide transport system permease protein
MNTKPSALHRHYLDLIRYRSYVDLKSESAQSYLGMLWWILDPLFYLAMYYLVFGVILQRGGEGFVGFLLCGLVFWRWFANSVLRASNSIQGNSAIISQVYLPKLIFPIVETISNAYRFAFILLIFMTFLVIYRQTVEWVWLSALPVLGVQLLLIFGVGICLALVVPFFPDIRKLIDNVMMLFFYMSGIFFDIHQLEPKFQTLLFLNPMAVLIDQYRTVFFRDQLPDFAALGNVTLVGLGLCLVGVWVGSRLDKTYPRVIK